ncbi:MAG: GNAT family N-acetyltransferase [Porphyromonadaceae bacterium]|jgi:ribosomal protein S18 acetylase RimI-like enzyme|nr:GNAT family N-acetyltransferase [Porphyromonadaceae bacterium]
MILFETLNNDNFNRFESEIIDVYLRAFTKGESAQIITFDEVKNSLRRIISIGFGVLARIDDKIAGFILAHPLENDEEFPKNLIKEKAYENALYIAEVAVDKEFREQGIAKELIRSMQEAALEMHYKSLILRVWDKNNAGVNLYVNTGFVDSGISIKQTKYRADKTPFEMNKIYLIKNLE